MLFELGFVWIKQTSFQEIAESCGCLFSIPFSFLYSLYVFMHLCLLLALLIDWPTAYLDPEIKKPIQLSYASYQIELISLLVRVGFVHICRVANTFDNKLLSTLVGEPLVVTETNLNPRMKLGCPFFALVQIRLFVTWLWQSDMIWQSPHFEKHTNSFIMYSVGLLHMVSTSSSM